MTTTPFTVSLGRMVTYYENVKNASPVNSAFIMVLLKANVADEDALADFVDLGLLLADASNTEADFTNYARKVLVAADLDPLPNPDYANNRRDLQIPDITYTAAGGTLDNNLTKAILCYDSDMASGTDFDIVPLAQYDFIFTTTGNDLVLKPSGAGIYRVQR